MMIDLGRTSPELSHLQNISAIGIKTASHGSHARLVEEPMNPSLKVWTLKSESSLIQFKVRHLMISLVTGNFRSFEGKLSWDQKDPVNSSATARIRVESVSTGDVSRDRHLVGPDFFDAARYPEITFMSTKLTKENSRAFTMEGNLTMHGASQAVVLQCEGPTHTEGSESSSEALRFRAKTKIHRKAFGLEWSPAIEAGGVLVGNEIEIKLELEFIEDGKPIKAS